MSNMSLVRTATIYPYNRAKALEYANKWALKRNPQYYDFNEIGGDCTNFSSQVIFAGSGMMNYSKSNQWYYISINKRSPSWTDVDLLHRFLTKNTSRGPFGHDVSISEIKPADIIQLSFTGNDDFGHSLVVQKTGNVPDFSNILIATHTIDRTMYPLSSYVWKQIRFIHIEGVYK